ERPPAPPVEVTPPLPPPPLVSLPPVPDVPPADPGVPPVALPPEPTEPPVAAPPVFPPEASPPPAPAGATGCVQALTRAPRPTIQSRRAMNPTIRSAMSPPWRDAQFARAKRCPNLPRTGRASTR